MTEERRPIPLKRLPRTGAVRPLALLAPALIVVLVLFGGGLILGLPQSLGYLPAAGMSKISLKHFQRVLFDPDFFSSLGLTLYVAGVSTLIAAALSLLAAMALVESPRWLLFIFQIPLTVPHLVIAIAMAFLLAPSGMVARLFQNLGWISGPGDFPLLINDPFCIGILLTYVWKEIPFMTLMILSALKNSGMEMLDVGRTLNAGPWQRFRYILLPILLPSLGAAGLIVFAYTFGAFEVPYLLGQTYPMSLPVWAYRNYSDVDLAARPEGIAIGIVIAVGVTGCIIASQRLARGQKRRGTVF